MNGKCRTSGDLHLFVRECQGTRIGENRLQVRFLIPIKLRVYSEVWVQPSWSLNRTVPKVKNPVSKSDYVTLDAATAASTAPGSVRGSEGNKAEWWSRKKHAFPLPRTDALIQTHMYRLHSGTTTQFCVHPKTPVASLSRSLSLEDRPVLPWDWSTGLPGNIVLPVPSP